MFRLELPSDFIHPNLDDGNVITFNIYPDSIYYIIKNIPHKFLYKHKHSSVIGIDTDVHPNSYTTSGRLYKSYDLITLHSPRHEKIVTSDQVKLFNQLLQQFKMLDSLLYIRNIIDDDFDKLPRYNSKLLLKVPLPFDNGEPIDLHTCDPMIKRFVRTGLNLT